MRRKAIAGKHSAVKLLLVEMMWEYKLEPLLPRLVTGLHNCTRVTRHPSTPR
jgi:hypothetical protein